VKNPFRTYYCKLDELPSGYIKLYYVSVCRHGDGSADAEERDNHRPGLLGDGPAPGRHFLPAYDEEDDDYYYDETVQTYDEDAGPDGADETYTDRSTALAAADTGQLSDCMDLLEYLFVTLSPLPVELSSVLLLFLLTYAIKTHSWSTRQ